MTDLPKGVVVGPDGLPSLAPNPVKAKRDAELAEELKALAWWYTHRDSESASVAARRAKNIVKELIGDFM